MNEFIDITQEGTDSYTKILCPAKGILDLVRAPKSIWYLREEDSVQLEAADPSQWYRVDLFLDRSKK